MISSWAENVGNQARAAVCSALATADTLAGFTDALFPNGNWDNQIASGIRRGFCGNPDNAPDPSDYVPFSGGQCDTLYNVSGVRTDGGAISGQLRGPISQGETPSPTPSCPTNRSLFLEGRNAAGTAPAFVQLGATNNPLNCNPLNAPQINLSRVDGQPDNCGNTSSNVPQYQPQITNRNVTYIDNSSQEVTENYQFTVNIPVIIGGILIAPVTIAGNNFTVELSVPINGDISFNFGQGPRGDTVTEGQPPNSPIPEPEDSETERRIIAVLVTATVDPDVFPGQIINQEGNPTIYGPRLGNVSFFCTAGDAAGWTSDIPVKNVRNYIRCPVPQGAINVQATPTAGVTFQLTRVFSSQENLRSQIGA